MTIQHWEYVRHMVQPEGKPGDLQDSIAGPKLQNTYQTEGRICAKPIRSKPHVWANVFRFQSQGTGRTGLQTSKLDYICSTPSAPSHNGIIRNRSKGVRSCLDLLDTLELISDPRAVTTRKLRTPGHNRSIC